jgi:hypothetical protein
VSAPGPGWYQSPGERPRYWDGAGWHDDAPEDDPEPEPGHWPAGIIVMLALAVVVFVGGLTIFLVRRTETSSVSAPAGGSQTTSDGPPFLITGTITLTTSSLYPPAGASPGIGSPCVGTGGFSDIQTGTDVTVTDEASRIVGIGHIVSSSRVNIVVCSLRFTVPGVPERPFYKVEVSHRGGLTYSLQDMKSRNWTIDATLGS